MNRLQVMTRHHLFWPAAVLVALIAANVIYRPGFISVEMRDGHLYGSVIDILRLSSPLILVSLGMMLVIATGGIDLSVGSVMAICGSLACLRISELDNQNSVGGVLTAIVLALVLAIVLGLWNGLLVTGFGIQPIVATLVLMVAGRGLAQLITSGQIITINSSPYKLIGSGYLLTLPFGIFIAIAVTVLTLTMTRRTALGMLLESVGGNAEASRLAGIRSRRITLMAYVFCALFAGVAGFMATSYVSGADGNNAGRWVELDAILAVVIGGTALAGGRFFIGGTVLGALIIQTLTTTVYAMRIDVQTSLLFKALVVIAVCLIQSPTFRTKVAGAFAGRRRPRPPDEPAAPTTEKVQVPA